VVCAIKVEYTSFWLMQRRFFGTAAKGANIPSTEMTLFELLETAEHPKFKRLAKLTCSLLQGVVAVALSGAISALRA